MTKEIYDAIDRLRSWSGMRYGRDLHDIHEDVQVLLCEYDKALKNRNKAVDVENLRKGIKIITEAYEHLSQDGTYCEATIETDFNNCKNEMRAVRDFIANGYLNTPDTIQVKREDVPKGLRKAWHDHYSSTCSGNVFDYWHDKIMHEAVATLLSEKQNEE